MKIPKCCKNCVNKYRGACCCSLPTQCYEWVEDDEGFANKTITVTFNPDDTIVEQNKFEEMTMESLSDLIDELNDENKKLKEKVEELSAQIEVLKGELKEEKPKGEIWKPKHLEKYWYVDLNNEIEYALRGESEEEVADGNCYPTEEKAEFEAQREKYTRLFRQYVEQHSEPLNWKDDLQSKWFVNYEHEYNKIEYLANHSYQSMVVYGSSEEVMREAVDFVGRENFLRYVIGVEE